MTAIKTPFLALLCGAALLAPASGAVSIAAAREAVVSRTMTYLNTPYLWGGMNQRTGMDCSAFVRLVYLKAGLNLPRVARAQYAQTLRLAPAAVLPGDLVFFAMKRPGTASVDHVGIYVGKGFFVHASFTSGVHIDSVTNPYYYARLVSVRKYRGF
jgi:cell wall-associated NlpC family hydrolase